MTGPSIMFGKTGSNGYVLTGEALERAKDAIVDAIKCGLPMEARRPDVLCYLFDEMKNWVREQTLIL